MSSGSGEAPPEALLDCRTTPLLGSQVDSIFYCTWNSGFSFFTHNTKVGQVFDITANPKRPANKHGGVSRNKTAMDFNHRGVRDLAVKFIEEVREDCDVDGIEMDFFRHPICLKNPAWGKDATKAELDKMTNMARRVRKVTERIGLKRQRPILVGGRVPDSVEYCKAMGIDIVRWLEEDLVDILAVSGYFRLTPWGVSVKLGHKYGVPVYACLSETRLRDGEARRVRASQSCYRARAANVWASGADGVYMFNSFNPRSPLWRQLGDPELLQTLDRVYTTGARGVQVINTWMANGEKRFLNRSVLSPERPRPLTPGKPVSVKLRVGRKIAPETARGAMPEVKLRLRVQKLTAPSALTVKVSGTDLGRGAKSGVWFDYRVEPSFVKKGTNRFEVMLLPGSTVAPVLQDLVLSEQQTKRP